MGANGGQLPRHRATMLEAQAAPSEGTSPAPYQLTMLTGETSVRTAVHASGKPHVYWDPYRLLTIAKALSQRLQTIDAQNSGYYRQQLAQFTSQWQNQTKRWEAQAASLKGKRAIVYHSGKPVLFTFSNGKAQWIDIELGMENGEEVEVLSGLKLPSRVIISNNLQLAHNVSVKEIKQAIQ